jgi:hypothetical protein
MTKLEEEDIGVPLKLKLTNIKVFSKVLTRFLHNEKSIVFMIFHLVVLCTIQYYTVLL